MAQPAMRCPVDATKSLEEVLRVASQEVALMLLRDGVLIGTMGLMKATWWYGHGHFMTERWHFVLPDLWNSPEAGLLLDEAVEIAQASGMEFIHQGKIRTRKNGVSQMMPRAYAAESG